MEGTITRVTYYNEETGYAVLRVRATRVEGGPLTGGGGGGGGGGGQAAPAPPPSSSSSALAAANAGGGVTVVGKNLPPSLARKGAVAAFTGAWRTHAKFGAQLEVLPPPPGSVSGGGGGGGLGGALGASPSSSSPSFSAAAPPSSNSTGWVECGPPRAPAAAAAFLAGAGLPGVGPAIAARIVAALVPAGSDDAGGRLTAALDAPDAARALRVVRGLSAAKAAAVKAAWDASRGSRAADAALRAAGAPPRLARALASAHGTAAPGLLAADPYSACDGLPGASWRAVEALAARAGAPPGSLSRGGAALAAVARTAAGKGGHTCVPWPEAERAALRLMAATGRPWPGAEAGGGLEAAARSWCNAGRLVVEAGEVTAAAAPAPSASAPPPALSSSPSPSPPPSAMAAASFAAYLERRVRGVGPGTAAAIVASLGPAGAAAVLGGPPGGAARALTSVPGVGPASAARFKARWDANERRLPPWVPPGGTAAAAPAPAPQPPPATPTPNLTASSSAWPPPGARVFTPDLHAAEAGTASALAALVRGRAPGAARVRAGMVESVLASLDAAAAAAAARPGGPPLRRLSDAQRAAVSAATTGSRLLLLTGGPGTGKTAATAAVVAAWKAAGLRFALAAPTGRAAARLAEAAGAPATTIHRLLDVRGGTDEREEEDEEEGGRDGGPAGSSSASTARPPRRARPGAAILADAVLVDEASLLDTPLAAALLSALAPHAQLVLVGDPDQLPPVGPGAVLEDVSAAAAGGAPIPRIVLASPFRQGDRSAIVAAAAEVHGGRVPGLVPIPRGVLGLGGGGGEGDGRRGEPSPDEWWGRWSAGGAPPEALSISPGPPPPGLARGHAELATVLTRLLPRLGFDPRVDVQVLTPVRAGAAGTAGLNAFLQTVLNPPPDRQQQQQPSSPPSPSSPSPAVDLPGGGVARVGDRVMQTVNDREADVCNGDVGVVVAAGPGARLAVAFSGGGSGSGGGGGGASPFAPVPRAPVVYDGPEALARLDLAWAATVHKAQGSEAPAAVLFLDASAQARPALTRRLLYTALTRARRCVVVVGDEVSIRTALAGGGAVGSAPRVTGLRGRLATALGGGGAGRGRAPPADPPLAAAA